MPNGENNYVLQFFRIIYACDRYPERYNKLCSLVDLTKIKCAKLIHSNSMDLEINDLNYILVDVSSTYTGFFHKKDAAGLNSLLRHFQYKSRTLLQIALQKFPTVKRVVFTTCSMFAEEGEKVVADALSRIENSYTLLDVREMLWREWQSVGYQAEYPFAGKCLRTRPELDFCQGYFIAVFERNFSVPVPLYVHKKPTEKTPTSSIKKCKVEQLKAKPLPKPVPTIKKVKKPRSRKKKKIKLPDLVQQP